MKLVYSKYIAFLTALLLSGTIAAQSSTATISGKVTAFSGEPMESVMIRLVGGFTDISLSTDEQGNYVFPDLPKNVNYAIELTKNDDIKKGVDIADIVRMGNNILGIIQIDNDFILTAMDVNNSYTLTTFDMVETRKAILNDFIVWPNKPSWQFIYSHYSATNAFSGKLINNLQQDIENLDFTAVKTGDANMDVNLD